MRSRLLAGWRGLFVASTIASLVLFPAVLAGEKPTSVMDSGNTGFGPNTGADEEDSIQRPRVYSRANYVWPFATGPRYGLLDVDQSELRKPGMLHTQVGLFDLSRGTPQLPETLQATNRMAELGAQYFVVQLHPDALSDNGVGKLTAVIEGAGGRIVGTRPVAAFVALLTQDALVAAQSHSGVMGVIPYHPAFKINPMVGRTPLADPYKAVSDVYTLDVRLFAGEDAVPVAEAISKLGGTVQEISDGYVRVDLHRDRLAALAALEPVARITESTPVFAKGEESSTVIQTGTYNNGALPYHAAGIDGSGAGIVSASTPGTGPSGEQLLMILDTGIQLDAGDLSNTRTDPGDGAGVGSTHRKVQLYT
ncbi:MAG: hypothetical protein R3344_08780, partial [Acidobacteriota bacterium]|nr:hypothetical protein [Acidobacteriota bacterium]